MNKTPEEIYVFRSKNQHSSRRRFYHHAGVHCRHWWRWILGFREDGASVITDIANDDAALVEYAQRSRANINMLRRYEKDLFMNIGDAAKTDEYKKKWDDALVRFHERMDAMLKIESDAKRRKIYNHQENILMSIRLVSTRFMAKLNLGRLPHTQDANKAIGDYKTPPINQKQWSTEYAKRMTNRWRRRLKCQNTAANKVQMTILLLARMLLSSWPSFWQQSLSAPLHTSGSLS